MGWQAVKYGVRPHGLHNFVSFVCVGDESALLQPGVPV